MSLKEMLKCPPLTLILACNLVGMLLNTFMSLLDEVVALAVIMFFFNYSLVFGLLTYTFPIAFPKDKSMTYILQMVLSCGKMC